MVLSGVFSMTDKLPEIVDRIQKEVLDTLSDGGDDWFAAEKINEVLDIINEYRIV